MTETNNPEIINGIVQKITYKNDSNGYCVLVLNTGSQEITVVGIMPFVSEGEYLNCTGNYIVHPTYGEQFKADAIERIIKQDSASILKYLSSGSIKGIGPATARRIVERFGEESLEVLENSPEELCTIKGISYEKALAICEFYKSQFGLREIMLKLAGFNITPPEALKIFKKLGNTAVAKIEDNPYILCGDGINFDFERAEEIADFYKIDKLSNERIFAGVRYVLVKNTINSHTCLPLDKLAEVSALLLDILPEDAEKIIRRSESTFELFIEKFGGREFVFLPEYHSSERYIASRINFMQNNCEKLFELDDLEIDRVENMLSIKFEDLQRQAVRAAIENGIFILTGGPGTGKTTTLNAMIKVFEHRGLRVDLAAPTGRAARRITELTGIASKTIHRMLEAEWNDDEKHVFTRNERNPLDCDVLIIDEMSMVDTFLFEAVLRSLRSGCRLIMVGDTDQLPSVGAGNILNDLLSFNEIPSVRLKTIFRQAQLSLIVTNAHKIVNGKPIAFNNSKDSDCFIIRHSSSEETANEVVRLVSERLPRAYNFSSLNDIQVLCPSKRFFTGSSNLNIALQNAINPPSDNKGELYFKGGIIRQGDKVMQIKNNYDIIWESADGEVGSGVFNGDIGIVLEADKRFNTVKVDFDGKAVLYTGEELGQLELAYAITVHKSQGSEFECIVLPVSDVPLKLRYRNLLYTAFTRAKQLLVVVGSEAVLSQMIANDKKNLRYTGLYYFLRGEY